MMGMKVDGNVGLRKGCFRPYLLTIPLSTVSEQPSGSRGWFQSSVFQQKQPHHAP